MGRGLAVIVALAGCDRVLGLTAVTPNGDATSATDAVTCAPNPNFLSDRLDNAMTCKPWGSPFASGSAMVSESAEGLEIAGNASGPFQGGCESTGTVPLDDVGIFVAIDDYLKTANAYTVFSVVLVEGSSAAQVDVTAASGIRFEGWAGAPLYGMAQAYDPVTMRFVRIRRDAETGGILSETSPDGARWRMLAATGASVAAPAAVTLALGAGDLAQGDPGRALFSHLNVCP